MYKLIALLFFILAVSNAELQNVAPQAITSYNSSVLHTDAYINLNKQQHEKNIQNYDNQIEIFKQSYAASLNAIQIKGDMLIDHLSQTSERHNSLEILSEFSRTCVTKYRKSIPTIASTKISINGCINAAQSQINTMLSPALASKTYLESYYSNSYEQSLKSCKNKFNLNNYYLNYTICVVEATNAAEDYTINNQKTFTSQMSTAHCTANVNIKKALECSYSIQNKTISQIAEANTLINKCLLGQDDCSKCSIGYSCSKVTYVDRSDVRTTSRTMPNVFYGRSDIKDCLMMKITY